MKLIRSINRLAALIIVLLFFGNCGKDIEGTFYLSNEARKYQIDTAITSIKMVDNHGISEEFFMDQYIWYATHHYFIEWGTDGDARGETYGVAYTSVVSRFMFMMVLRADVENSELEIEWNQKDRFLYNFSTKQIEDGIKPEIKFYDTMTVSGVVYFNIIEVNYTDKKDEIDKDTPLITYISGKNGLIKLVRKDGIVLERTH
jgi:hypothetical protein